MQTENPSEAGGAERLLERAGAAGPWLPALEIAAWAVFFVLAGVFLTLRYWLLPNIERYRGDIVAVLSRSIGLPVRIGAISANWHGLRPELRFTDVRLYDKRGREALALPAVDNVIAWSSLLHLDLRLHSLAIEAPRLAVRRDAQGAISVAGIEVGGRPQKEGGFAAWLLEQRDVVVHGAEIQWIDEKRNAPPLVLTAINLHLRNAGARHQIGFTAQPPKALGASLDVRARLTGAMPRQLTAWNGEMYVNLGSTDLAAWRTWVDYPIDVREGVGSLRLWATFGDEKLQRATADVALSRVVARLGRDLPLLEVKSVSGRLQGGMTGGGYQFGVRNLRLATGQGLAMRPTTFQVLWEPAVAAATGGTVAESRPAHGAISATLIQLGPLARLAEYLPLPVDVRRLLAELEPQGTLHDVSFDWSGTLPDAATYSGRARFSRFAMSAWHAIPGFAGLSGSVSANQAKGTLYLDSRSAEVDLPKIFPEPRVPLDALSGQVDWERPAPGAVKLRLVNVSFANAHLAGSAFGTYSYTEGRGPGVIDLSARLARADGRFTAKYLPLETIMNKQARSWVADSILTGRSDDVRLRLRGDLRNFPFVDPAAGQFQVTAHVTDGVLAYAPDWPRIEAIDGELVFDRDRVEIVGRSATISGVALSNVRVTIPSMIGPTRVLVSGQADGPTDDFLKFIQRSPVRGMIERFTDGMSATGPGRLQLKLDLPLNALKQSKISGDFQLANDSLRLRPGMPALEHLNGSVGFTESALTLHNVKAQLLGSPVAISGGSKPGQGVAVSARGQASVAGLRAAFGHPWWRYLSGSAAYVASVVVRGGSAQVSFESSLAGVASALPPPLAKAAGEPLPLKVEFLPGEGDARDRISVVLGKRLRAELLRVRQDGAMVLQRASVALNPVAGAPMRLPEREAMSPGSPATLVYGTLPALDLDRWLPLFAGNGAAAGAATFDLKLGVLDAFGKRVHDVTLRAGVDASGWSANVQATELAGDLSYRYQGGGKLIARLKHFQIPEDAPGVKPQEGVKDLPAVDLVTDQFTFRGKQFGRVEVSAQREGANWRIAKLAMVNPDATLNGHGLWNTAPPGDTSLEFQLDASDVGKFLARIGYPDYVKDGTATLSGDASWRGDPLAIDYPSLSGKLELQAKNGRFLEIDPGVGKLISLVSLQSLPQHITLGFTDVFSKGFQFDRISSSLQVQNGSMTTKDFRMSGSGADVDTSGEVNLVRETQDLQVRVVPKLGASTSSLLTLVNPVAGVTSAIAQSLLKNPLGQIFAYKYEITGTWSEPKVKKLQPENVSPYESPPAY
ncbi:MAG: YhdP family protein [Betaproteobacteria bacterium]|nr:YhdP family protein [Betaproteobacteria bacterium]